MTSIGYVRSLKNASVCPHCEHATLPPSLALFLYPSTVCSQAPRLSTDRLRPIRTTPYCVYGIKSVFLYYIITAVRVVSLLLLLTYLLTYLRPLQTTQHNYVVLRRISQLTAVTGASEPPPTTKFSLARTTSRGSVDLFTFRKLSHKV